MVIESSIVTFGVEVFKNCSNIIALTIPINIDAVVSNVSPLFSDSTKISSITFTAGSGTWYAYGQNQSDGSYYKYAPWNITRADLTVNTGCGVNYIAAYTFSECSSLKNIGFASVVSIGDHAFYNCGKLSFISVTADLISLGDHAFCGCTSLKSMFLPNSLTTIGDYVFCGCTSIASVNIPDSVTTIGNGAFEDCTALAVLVIPDSVTSVGIGAFANCTALKTLVIESTNVTFGGGAFKNCSNLTDLTIPININTVGSNDSPIFAGCTKIANITFTAGSGTWYAYGQKLSDGSYHKYAPWNITGADLTVNTDGGVNYIAAYTFADCSSLKNLSFASVTSIEDRAFYNCGHLRSIPFTADLISIGDYAFAFCTSLDFVEIPDSVTTIGISAFSRCSNLSVVNIGKSVTTIGIGAFENCTALITVSIPDSVTTLGNWAFSDCYSLTTAYIGSSVSYLGFMVFAYCKNLSDVTLWESTVISNFAFIYCGEYELHVRPVSQTLTGAQEHTVTFVNGDQVLQETKVRHGEVPVYYGDLPTVDSADGHAFVFIRWDSEITEATGDVVYHAVFSAWDAASSSVHTEYHVDGNDAVIEDTDNDSVSIIGELFDRINSDLDKGTIGSVSFKLNNGSVTFSPQAASGVSGVTDVSIVLDDQIIISDEAKKLIGDRPVYNITVNSADGNICQFDGKLMISVKYELREGEDANKICIIYLKDDGTYSTIDAKYSDGYVTFTTDHLSSYAVAFETDSLNTVAILSILIGAILVIAVGIGCWGYCRHEN